MGEGYAHDIIGDLNAGSIGWIDWNLLLDENGGPNHVDNVCDAAMMANLSKGDVYHHPQYYYIGHFSKFIHPDSVRLVTTVGPTPRYNGTGRPYGTCTGEDGLEATSFRRPDGRVSTVVLNCGEGAIDFKLLHGDRAASTSIPPHSIQTYVFEGDGPAALSRAGGAAPLAGGSRGGWAAMPPALRASF
jgi:glucosylceramidase